MSQLLGFLMIAVGFLLIGIGLLMKPHPKRDSRGRFTK